MPFHRDIAENCVQFNGLNIVGDYSNGNIYALDLDNLTDNGEPRKWLRTWRALAKPVEDPVSFHSLRIDMETGAAAIDPNSNPQVILRWSDDGGHTWSNERFTAAGRTGQTAKRVMFNRLGGTRRNSGLDRIFELSSADEFPVAIIGAEIEAS